MATILNELEPEEPSNKKMEKIETIMKKDGTIISSTQDTEGLSSRGYGISKNGNLVLMFYEALYLLYKKIIIIKDEKTEEEINFQNLLQHFKLTIENAWVKYLVYRDLRSRGYVVRRGFGLGIDFRVYNRGNYGKEIARYLIFVIQEGQPVLAKALAQTLNYIQSLKKRLILAVVNRRGEIVYYSLSQLTF